MLTNAIRHTPNGTTVTTTLEARDGKVIFRIADQGPGIPDSELETIFDVYVTKAGEEARGHGLGLPLSRRLARLLGGELRAVEDAPEGACFELELPAGSS